MEGQRTIFTGILLAKLGVSPYIKNIGPGVLIFMAQQVAKHMAKAGVKMSNFTVLRMQKLKSIIAVRRSMKHAFREQETPNADPARLSENTHFCPKCGRIHAKFQKKLPEKYEKWRFGRWIPNYGLSKRTWIKDRWGNFGLFFGRFEVSTGQTRGRKCGLRGHTQRWNHTAYVCVHRATGWTRQAQLPQILWCKNALSDLQTDFFWASRPQTWFDRGIKGSKAKHTKIRDYYARVNAVEDLQIEPDADIEFPSPTLVDKAKTYDYGYKVAESVTAQLTKQYESKLKTAAIKFQDKLHEKTCKSVGLEITVLQGLGEWRIDCKKIGL